MLRSCGKKGFIRKLWLMSKLMALQTSKQIITTHILSNVPTTKCNQTMKFGQLKEYNMRYIFLQKSCRK